MSWWDFGKWGMPVVGAADEISGGAIGGAVAGDKSTNIDALGDALAPPKVPVGNYGSPAYTPEYTDWGGGANGADVYSRFALNQIQGQGSAGQKFTDAALTPRAPQAYENQQLSDNEAFSRGYDQNGAMQLAREQAMGMAPSAAAYQMQSGLNQAMANQSSMMGSARGNAGMALAGANSAANVAGLQNQTYNQAGQLRAQEMQSGLGAYGSLANTQVSQDLERLGLGNTMAQANASNANQYMLGMGGVGAQYGNNGLGWFNASMHPQDMEAQLQNGRQNTISDSWNRAQDRAAGIATGNADRSQQNTNGWVAAAGTAAGTAMS